MLPSSSSAILNFSISFAIFHVYHFPPLNQIAPETCCYTVIDLLAVHVPQRFTCSIRSVGMLRTRWVTLTLWVIDINCETERYFSFGFIFTDFCILLDNILKISSVLSCSISSVQVSFLIRFVGEIFEFRFQIRCVCSSVKVKHRVGARPLTSQHLFYTSTE